MDNWDWKMTWQKKAFTDLMRQNILAETWCLKNDIRTSEKQDIIQKDQEKKWRKSDNKYKNTELNDKENNSY